MDEKNEATQDSWDDIDLSDIQDDGTDEDGDGTPTEPEETGDAGQKEQPKEEKDQFELTFLGEKKTFGRDEITQLAQKGLNYDHLQAKLQEAEAKAAAAENSEAMNLLKSLAEANGQTVEQFVMDARIQKYAETHGISTGEAKRLLDIEAREAALQKKEQAQSAENARREEFLAFARNHPDVKPDKIPQEVWKRVHEGMSLDAAYTEHENQQLRAQLEALKQAQTNAERSAGSASSAGKSEMDEFDALWYDGT